MSKSYRPVYHASVPSGWSNDPNGTIYYNGKAHLFFQHYPYKPAWGIMHWGHFTTEDLVHWDVLPVALRPDQDYEALCGCCSGSAIEKDGDLYLMYTAAQPDLQRQCLARSEDGGITFVKREDNPILTADMLSEEVSSYDFRDPRLFKKDGYYYFLAGARVIDLGADEEELDERTRKWDKLRASSSIRYSPSIFESVAQDDVRDEAQGDTPGDSPSEEPHSGVSSKIKSPSVGDVFGQDPIIAGFGNLLLCKSSDLEHWEYVGHLLHRQPQFEEDFYNLNGVYECPDYLVIDGQEIVLSSPQNLPQMDNLYQNVHSGLYLLGKLDFETGRYDLEKIGELDSGFDFYAAQTLHMPDGRPVMIAWKEMWDRNYPTQAEGWAGTYTFPRELSLDGDCLIQKPARELDAFCQNRVSCDSLTVTDDEVTIPGIDGTVARIRLTMEPGTASKAGLKLFAGEKHETLLYYDREEGVLAIDRSKSGLKITGKEENVTVRKLDVGHPESIELEMLLDVSSLEVFINGGRHVMTANVYPDPEDTAVRFFAQGGSAKFEDIEKFDVVV